MVARRGRLRVGTWVLNGGWRVAVVRRVWVGGSWRLKWSAAASRRRHVFPLAFNFAKPPRLSSALAKGSKGHTQGGRTTSTFGTQRGCLRPHPLPLPPHPRPAVSATRQSLTRRGSGWCCVCPATQRYRYGAMHGGTPWRHDAAADDQRRRRRVLTAHSRVLARAGVWTLAYRVRCVVPFARSISVGVSQPGVHGGPGADPPVLSLGRIGHALAS